MFSISNCDYYFFVVFKIHNYFTMDNEKKEIVFKVPKLSIGPRPGLKKSLKCVDVKSLSDSNDTLTTNTTGDIKERVEDKTDQLKKNVKKTTSQVPIPYEEPSWGGKPGDKYFLEV